MTQQACKAKCWSYLLPLLLGGLILLPGIKEIGISRQLTAHGQTAAGEVIAIDKPGTVSGGRPMVTFQTHDGRAVQKVFNDPLGGSYRVGEQVAVLYDPHNPLEARIFSGYGMYAGIALPFALALVFWSIAVVVLVRRPRQKPACSPDEAQRNPGLSPGFRCASSGLHAARTGCKPVSTGLPTASKTRDGAPI